ncbi:hypothetical protein DPEC_G00320540 [Dallia pectoralis]|uniref:Uncharacterized protein n=1 Tax=Dallia pectoralis TaxID=75939 RepID=A0ACC2F9X3_DALPE|nr:hypothetical protein DPEC_G00320540 [Dallia pectoralis]
MRKSSCCQGQPYQHITEPPRMHTVNTPTRPIPVEKGRPTRQPPSSRSLPETSFVPRLGSSQTGASPLRLDASQTPHLPPTPSPAPSGEFQQQQPGEAGGKQKAGGTRLSGLQPTVSPLDPVSTDSSCYATRRETSPAAALSSHLPFFFAGFKNSLQVSLSRRKSHRLGL